MADGNMSNTLSFNDSTFNSSVYFANHSDDVTRYTAPSETQTEKVYWAIMMVPLPLVAVVGNILVILSVYKERSLQSATNYFIVSLAFADLLVAAVVMPFAVYVLVNVDWELSETLCDFYIALDVTCSTASIFNLVAISIDRFIAVTQPIKYSKHKNSKRILLTIVFVWLVSAAIGSPIMLGLNTSAERIPNLCVFYNSDFIIYSSLTSFYVPCVVMVYLYYKIFRAIRERARKAMKQKTIPAKTMEEDGSRENHNKEYGSTQCSGVLISSIDCRQKLMPLLEVDETSQMLPSDEKITINDDYENKDDSRPKENDGHHNATNKENNAEIKSVDETQLCAKDPHCETRVKEASPKNGKASNAVMTSTVCFKINGSSPSEHPCGGCSPNLHVKFEKADHKSKCLFGLTKNQKHGKKKREKNAARRERKATKTLAIVLGVFLICWVPFFTCNILDAICIKLQSDQCRPGVTAFLLTTWLGYINSCVNPVIYTIFNIEFRKAFKKLLLEPCKW